MVEHVNDFQTLPKNNFKSKYSAKIIDILENPQLAEADGIFATPTVIRTCLVPIRRIVGSLGEQEKVLAMLYLEETKLGLAVSAFVGPAGSLLSSSGVNVSAA